MVEASLLLEFLKELLGDDPPKKHPPYVPD
jgi:hypothetical protein